MRTKTVSRAACVLLGLEGLALVVLVVWQIAAVVSGDTDSLESAWALVALTLAAAAAVLAVAVAGWRGFAGVVWGGGWWGQRAETSPRSLSWAGPLGAAPGV